MIARVLLVPALVLLVLADDLPGVRALVALGVLLIVVAIETRYSEEKLALERANAELRQSWENEHKAFQDWIATEHRRRSSG